MSKWRPKGWENPHQSKVTGDQFYPSYHCLEEGADAMLEGICEEIEKKENSYGGDTYDGYEQCRNEILTLLRSKGG